MVSLKSCVWATCRIWRLLFRTRSRKPDEKSLRNCGFDLRAHTGNDVPHRQLSYRIPSNAVISTCGRSSQKNNFGDPFDSADFTSKMDVSKLKKKLNYFKFNFHHDRKKCDTLQLAKQRKSFLVYLKKIKKQNTLIIY